MGHHINFKSPPPGWSLSADGSLTRPVDLIESWFLDRISLSGSTPQREHEGLTYGLKIKLPSYIKGSTSYVQRAWMATWHLHPMLGATYPPFSGQDHEGKACIRLSPMTSEEWLSASFRENEGKGALFKNFDDALKTFQAPKTAMAHWFPSSSQLLIRTTHIRCDAMTLFKITNTFMTVLASVVRLGLDADVESYTSDIEHPSLGPGVDYMLGLGSKEENTPEHIGQEVEKIMDEWQKGSTTISTPILEGSEVAVPGDSRQLRIEFDEATSKAIQKACKAQGISVSAAFHTSLVRVTTLFPQHPEACNILITLIANLRHLLGPNYNAPQYAIGPCCYLLPFTITNILDNGWTFGQLAKQIHSIYSTNFAKLTADEEGNPVTFFDLLKPYSAREAEFLGAEPSPSLPPLRPPNLSSFGVLERFLKREYQIHDDKKDACEIEDVRIGFEMLAQTAEFQLCSFRDTIRLFLCFNEAYYDEDFMHKFMLQIKEDVIKGLEIETEEKKTMVSKSWTKSMGSWLAKRRKRLLRSMPTSWALKP